MSTHDLDSHRQAQIQAQTEDAAIEWIARLRASDVTDAERADFAEWLAASDAHKRAFDDMAALWGLTAQLEVSDVPAPATQKPGLRRWAPMALAASAFLAFAALLLAGGGDTFRTELGEQRRVVLVDGSSIYLNTGTKIEVRYSDSARNVLLETGGEAYFEVASDAKRPFTVRTTHGTAEALGTAFNVFANAAFTAVAVTEGRVGVTSPDGDTGTLQATQRARLAEGDLVLENAPRPADIAAWRTGRLVYDGITLQALVADLNRYLPKPMSLADARLADMSVSAVLTLQEQDAMLDALAHSLDLRWTTVSDNLILLHAAH